MMNRESSTAQLDCNEMRERRGFFRISDDVVLTYHLVDEEAYLEQENKESNNETNSFNIKAKFAAIDRSLRPVMARLKERSEDLAHYLQAINDKLDMLAEVLFLADNNVENLPSQEVNLSAGGMSFQVQSPIEAGKILKLRVLLPLTGIGIESFARVVYCRQEREPGSDPFPYRVGVEFKHMREEDSDLIIRHVLCKEAVLRRQGTQGTEQDA